MKNLLEFLGRHYHWLIFVFLEAVSLTLLFSYNSYHNSVWFSSANAVAGRFYQWTSAVESYFSLTKVNEDLTLRNFYLERQVTQLRRLYSEATQEVSVKERQELEMLERYKLIPAKVVTNELEKQNNLLTINKGEADGVEEGMGVACGKGVVGVVFKTSSHYSIVIPVLNVESSRISCAIRGHGYFGVLRLQVRLSTDFGNLRDVVVISDKSIAERVRLMQAARDSIQVR